VKKKLILIAYESIPRDKYLKDLQDFFGDRIEVEGYSLKEGINKTIYGDLALMTFQGISNLAKEYLSDNMDMIYLNRTLKKGNFNQLNEIPDGTKAMLVNNSKFGGIETISLLYKMGINHVDFTTVYPNMDNIPEYDYAVTPGQLNHVPPNVKHVIDIGWRVIDVSTLMDIATKLDILDDKLNRKLEAYLSTIIPSGHGLDFMFNSTNKIKNQLNIILDIMDDGVLVVDNNSKVIHCNRSLEIILNITEKDILNKKISDLVFSTPSIQSLTDNGGVENCIIKHIGTSKNLVVTKRPIKVDQRICGYVFIIKDKSEIENLENQLRRQFIDRGYIAKYTFEDIIGISENIIDCKNRARKISRIEAPVLILGESGTGKELFAQAIHNESGRNNKPFLGINCASLSSDLLESELFGYEEGAFTGARKGGKKGLFELSHTGSLFLDEIGELPMYMQAKLLRALQEKEVMRIGGIKIIPVDVRIIAATNQNLKLLVKQGKFRKDLYYRLNVLTLDLPPLRERRNDIPTLIDNVLRQIGAEHKKMDDRLKSILTNHYWDGNIREFRNCIEYMAYMGDDSLTVKDLPPDFLAELDSDEMRIEEQRFPELLYEEEELALYILKILTHKRLGRRAIHNEACQNGFIVSEHRVRKIMDYLCKEELIVSGVGRSGSRLSEKGKVFI